jgi:hypothetical protein
MRPLIVLAALLLNACATEYQPQSFTGGFSETRLGENVWEVSFKGNGYTGRDRASDFTLLRSADVALQHGYRYFVVVNRSDLTRTGTYTQPTTSYTTANATAYGNTAYGTATTNTYGGQTFNIVAPGLSNTIMCFKDKPDVQGLVFDAQYLSASIKSKYGMK